MPTEHRKRPLPETHKHCTTKRTAADFVAQQHITTRPGPYSSLEYFLIVAIVEAEFGLLVSDALPGNELHTMYTDAPAALLATNSTVPVYPWMPSALLQLASTAKQNYAFVDTHALTQ